MEMISASQAKNKAQEVVANTKQIVSAELESVMGHIKEAMQKGKFIVELDYEISGTTQTKLEALEYRVKTEPDWFVAGQSGTAKTYIRWE